MFLNLMFYLKIVNASCVFVHRANFKSCKHLKSFSCTNVKELRKTSQTILLLTRRREKIKNAVEMLLFERLRTNCALAGLNRELLPFVMVAILLSHWLAEGKHSTPIQ